jgi:hypothetical protein
MAGVDPVSFRERLLQDNPRMLAVMHTAVQKVGWTPGVGRSGQGYGLALDSGDGTYVAEVARCRSWASLPLDLSPPPSRMPFTTRLASVCATFPFTPDRIQAAQQA